MEQVTEFEYAIDVWYNRDKRYVVVEYSRSYDMYDKEFECWDSYTDAVQTRIIWF